MNPAITVRPRADRDVDAIADDIAEYNLEAAGRFYDAVQQAYEFLASFPQSGSLWRSRKPAFDGLRVWGIRGFENYLIFYRPQSDGIEIVRVLHGARDLTQLMGGSSD